MKTVLVVSDTHGSIANLEDVIQQNRNIDFMIHLGDVCGDENYLFARVHYPVKILRGNNDWSYSLPDKAVMELEGHKIFAAHGHNYNIYSGTERLISVALQQGCDIIMYGHTHVPKIEEEEEYTILNPGSLTYPRQRGRKPSYIIMKMYDDGHVEYELKYV